MNKSSKELLIKAVEINPEDVTAHGNLGNMYFNEERYEEAIEAYQKIIQINPEQVAAYNNLINAYNRTLQNQVKKKPFGFFRKLFNILRK